MKMLRYEKFQMTATGYIYVSKQNRKIHAISLYSGHMRIVDKIDSEAKLLINGMLLTSQLQYSSEFYRLMKYIDRCDDPFISEAITAFRNCYHSGEFERAIFCYID